jgi:hypothetical protein
MGIIGPPYILGTGSRFGSAALNPVHGTYFSVPCSFFSFFNTDIRAHLGWLEVLLWRNNISPHIIVRLEREINLSILLEAFISSHHVRVYDSQHNIYDGYSAHCFNHRTMDPFDMAKSRVTKSRVRSHRKVQSRRTHVCSIRCLHCRKSNSPSRRGRSDLHIEEYRGRSAARLCDWFYGLDVGDEEA